jgi:hypothetical protein
MNMRPGRHLSCLEALCQSFRASTHACDVSSEPSMNMCPGRHLSCFSSLLREGRSIQSRFQCIKPTKHAHVPKTAPELPEDLQRACGASSHSLKYHADQACICTQDGTRATFKPSVGCFVQQVTLVTNQANQACACAQDGT